MKKDASEFNLTPRIRMIDKNGDLMQVINQIDAGTLVKNGFCTLLLQIPVTIQFNLERDQWHPKLALDAPPLWFRQTNLWLQSRKCQLYGNYRILHPEGYDMFWCDHKKAMWYLNRDLVDIVSQDPPTLQLKFIPKGHGNDDDIYYLTPKENKCVACGADKDLTRHHVVPSVFRRHAPEHAKSRNHHDILLLCVDCHNKYELHADDYKQELCAKYDIPYNKGSNKYLPEVGRVAKAAFALLRFGPQLPQARKDEILNQIGNYLGKNEVTSEDIDTVSKLGLYAPVPGHKDYGLMLLEKVDFQKFTEAWRQHFLDHVQPKFMPQHWDVHKPIRFARTPKQVKSA